MLEARNLVKSLHVMATNAIANIIALQSLLFEEDANVRKLREYSPKSDSSYAIYVCRNHSFEIIEGVIKPYLDYAGIRATFTYSDYDDSLSFGDLDPQSDMIILWLDLSRYSESFDISKFLHDRIGFLEQNYKKNILFVPFGKNVELDKSRIILYKNLDNIKEKLGDKYLDLRMEKFSGTQLSLAASLEIARDLGLRYIPSMLKSALKGIVLDLDNTLYEGVLGEDGIHGVRLTHSHARLQTMLKELGNQGFFLSVASKNDEKDVLDLFEKRQDFPLKVEDFTKICAHWNSKAQSISDIAAYINISPDSLLFIDDNLGEIVSVLEHHPEISVLWAKENAALTCKALSETPGFLKLTVRHEDNLRKKDVQANQYRKNLEKSLSKENYIKQLNMQLTFSIDQPAQLERVSELSRKTNQFIFSYKRYTQSDVQDLMQSPSSRVVAISLKDDLSDSGIIGVVTLKKYDDVGFLEECFVSCRALGRGIDEAIVLGAIQTGLKSLGLQKLHVSLTKGDRNLPAEKFLEKNLVPYKDSPSFFSYDLPTDLIKIGIQENV
jgi:FkbH-like protein